MDDDYKVYWQILNEPEQVSDWLTEKQALKLYSKIEANAKAVWCDVFRFPIDEGEEEGEILVKRLDREVVDLGICKMVIV